MSNVIKVTLNSQLNRFQIAPTFHWVRDTIAKEMTPSQIEKAQDLAREFQARNK